MCIRRGGNLVAGQSLDSNWPCVIDTLVLIFLMCMLSTAWHGWPGGTGGGVSGAAGAGAVVLSLVQQMTCTHA